MSTELDLSEEAHLDAYDLAVVLADTKFITAHRYSEWAMLGAPDIEEDIALSSIIQDELGHARAGYKSAEKVGNALPSDISLSTTVDDLLYERGPEAWRSPEVLDHRFDGWADVIASLAILDYATILLYESVRDGSFGPLQSMAGKVLQEESQHAQHGQAWFSVYADESQDEFDPADLQTSIDKFVPGVATWLGTGGSDSTLVDAGVLAQSNDSLREEFLEDIEDVVTANGFEMPAVSPDWSAWDESTRRTEPPSERFDDTVEAATGREHKYLAE
ncbi:1,2-phenylacetyl-CoA epoxidase subunit PaaC [Haloarchaeobius sp. TZWSO28]|uniref:1,2-phenylacetyl-CoA epoxidase subunit PaaC n=1 Tax=Haloarchaeobius sp. TZWSO28 TaxID=3446119 RepID=UPI003EC03222